MASSKKQVLVLGATGSIGLNAVNIISSHSEEFEAKALVAGRDAKKLAELALRLKPEFVGIYDKTAAQELKALLSSTKIKILFGHEGIIQIAQAGYDIVISGIVGAAGLAPTMAALENCKTMALANKESLVCAGSLLTDKVIKNGVKLIPVDSEHSAIFQCLEQHNHKLINKITLTASGGPFRTKTFEEIKNATPEQALNHPNWKMGNRITIDSATLANKGLEYIEACVLFSVKPSQIEVVVHPQSIVHSMVTYSDSSTIAQLGLPDMRTPIAYAMAYPKRLEMNLPVLDLAQVKTLTFEKPDIERFPMLKIAMDCMDTGLSARIIFNAADEVAVEAFLKGHIKFMEICEVVHRCLNALDFKNPNTIDEVLEYDKLTRIRAKEIVALCASKN